MSKDQNWSQYWQNESETGEVFVNTQGQKHQAISNHWRDQFSSFATAGRVLDIACGAGSIYADLHPDHNFSLFAADYSKEAIDKLSQRLPSVSATCCPADKLPYQNEYFDAVVSQFGIEYAGLNAFVEAFRVLRPGGHLNFLCHIENGFIDAKNKQELDAAIKIKSEQFIEKSISLTASLYANDESAIKQAMDKFTKVEPTIAAMVGSSQQGVHCYLYHSLKNLLANRQAYNKEDIVNWLKGMQAEVDKTILRLTEMRKASLSESQIEEIRRALVDSQDFASEPFILPNTSRPLAWHVVVTKKG